MFLCLVGGLLLAAPGAQAQFTLATNNGAIVIARYTGTNLVVTVPDATNGYPVTTIGSNAFYAHSSVTSITLGSNITTLQAGAFQGCESLTNFTIPDGVTSIGDSAFESSGLIEVTVPDGVTNLGEGVFFSCDRLASVTLGRGVACLSTNLFNSCGVLTNVTLVGCVASIGPGAFEECFALTSFVIPDSVTCIGGLAFEYCRALTNVTIGNGVTNIEDGAFSGCGALGTVTLGSGVAVLGDGAFSGCGLKAVCFWGNAPSAGPYVYSDDNRLTNYYLPGTTGWGSRLSGMPTALWTLPTPVILNQSPNFGVQSNQFGFTISWATNVPIAVEACTDLGSGAWQPLQTGTLSGGVFYFSDPGWTNYGSRFYRVGTP
jgi:hypothetical protein